MISLNDSNTERILEAIRDPYGLSHATTATPLGNGHINQTVLVSDGEKALVAQRINTVVFPDPQALIHNARAVSSHMAQKKGAPGVVRHLAGLNGHYLHGVDSDVRVLEFISGTRSIEVIESVGQAREAAFTFARFSRFLSDFDSKTLKTIIPDFHNPNMRFENFLKALTAAPASSKSICADDIRFVHNTEPLLAEWSSLINSLPVRVCHNDCKINNILVDQDSGKARTVIDLDTVMPGCLMTDFGDLVRSCSSPEAEDSKVLENVVARPEVFAALAEAYIEGLDGVITPDEVNSLMSGALMVCFIQGVRFLTDFLEGNRYFAVTSPMHNLDRARNQFQLFRSLQAQEAELRKEHLSGVLAST